MILLILLIKSCEVDLCDLIASAGFMLITLYFRCLSVDK